MTEHAKRKRLAKIARRKAGQAEREAKRAEWTPPAPQSELERWRALPWQERIRRKAQYIEARRKAAEERVKALKEKKDE